MSYGNSTEFYRNNPNKYEARKRQIHERRKQLSILVKEYKATKSCIRCGFSDPRAIDFHHRDADEKEADIARMYQKGWGWERMQRELDKCDPLCRNCHAIIHAEERETALIG